MIATQSNFNKFGKKMKELISLVESTENWEEYVEPNTVVLINDLIAKENISSVMEEHDLSYNNLRAKYLTALDRIKNNNKERIRNGGSEKARLLFDLVDSTANWKSVLTNREIKYVESFKTHKNFYEVGRILNAKPGNIAGTLYGTSQRDGVIDKLKRISQ